MHSIFLQGNYRIENGTFDLSIIGLIPLEPQNIYVNITFLEHIVDPNTSPKKNRQIYCLDALVVISLARADNRRQGRG